MKHRALIAAGVAMWMLGVSLCAAVFQVAPSDTIATVTVDAKHPWVDAGLTVHKGDRLLFRAEGSIQWGSQPGEVAGPDGHGAKPGKLGKAGLIGKVGYNGKPFPIGSTRAALAMPKDGKLFLGINDFIFGDNAGAFTVMVRRAVAP